MVARSLRRRTLLQRVAAAFDVAPAALAARGRQAPLARARFAFCWLAARELGASHSEIAATLGGRDRTTALHAVRRGAALRDTDPDFRARTDQLLASLREARDA